MREKAFERLSGAFAEEATRLLVSHSFQNSGEIAKAAVQAVLARGGERLFGIVRGGLLIDDETKAWWAKKVEEGVERLVIAPERLTALTSKMNEVDTMKAELGGMESKLAKARIEFSEVAGFDYDKFVEICVEVSKNILMPPLTSPNNVEVGAMGLAHLFARLCVKMAPEPWFVTAFKEHPKLKKMIEFFAVLLDLLQVKEELIGEFLVPWARSAYARLEIGHKIAASFCLTDVPDGFVETPWEAWSLVVPDGLLGAVARVWSVGLNPVVVLGRDGRRYMPTRVEGEMIQCLVRSSALALSNPDEFKKERKHAPTARSANERHSGPPDLAHTQYLISAPVEVDLRENVAAALEDERLGRKHASPKVQFLVRGHPRMQVHGEGRALRKKIWIQPFWKGPEEGRILLRSHRVDT